MYQKIKKWLNLPSQEQINLSNEPWKSNDHKNPKVNLGQIQAALNRKLPHVASLHDVEFCVYSQWGDDGIIQYILSKIDFPNRVFIEFGVQNYQESNTRFLLVNNNWSGLIIDASEENIKFIKDDPIFWAFDLHAICAFITAENINNLIQSFLNEGYSKEIGILSIDIDGVDYWIWKAIDVIKPLLVIVEYNSLYGLNPWTVPYQSDFYRHDFGDSHQYWGASLSAFNHLAIEKGFTFIGCNSAGNNAYFLCNDKLNGLPQPTLEEGIVHAKFREYIDANGVRIGGQKRLRLIEGMPIYNVENGQTENILIN